MSKKTKYILAAIGGSMVLVVGFAWLGMWKNGASQESIVFSQLANFLNTQQLQLEGTIKTTEYSADFKTIINQEASKTDAVVSLSSFPKGDIQADVVSVKDKTFFKVTDASTLLEALPDDPASRAIKANLARVASEYKGKWIELDDETVQNNFGDCLMSIRTYALNSSDAESSFTKHTFFEVSDVKQETSGTTAYHLTLNDKLPAFLADISGQSLQEFEACKAGGTALTIFFDEEQNQIVKIEAARDNTVMTISQFNYEEIPEITPPSSNLTLNNVKTSLGELFVR